MECDTIPYEPKTYTAKKVDEMEYFNVILILNNKIKSNFLFTDLDLAKYTFINIMREYCPVDLTIPLVNECCANKIFVLSNGSISITSPDIKIT